MDLIQSQNPIHIRERSSVYLSQRVKYMFPDLKEGIRALKTELKELFFS